MLVRGQQKGGVGAGGGVVPHAGAPGGEGVATMIEDGRGGKRWDGVAAALISLTVQAVWSKPAPF